MLAFQQSESTAALRRFPIYLVDGSDGITPVTGETGTPQVSKNFGAFANTTNALTEVGNGLYYVELTATELDTLGTVTVRYNSGNVAEFNLSAKVVAFDPFDANLGAPNLDAAVSSRATQGDILSDATPFAGANIDAAISTRSNHAAADVVTVNLSELTQGQPAASPTLEDAIMLLYMAMRNSEEQDASEYRIKNDAGTVIAKASVSDDGTVVTKGKMASGP